MKKKILTGVILTLIYIIKLSSIVNAASQIEIIPTEKGIRDITVSTSFVTCRNLDSIASTLGTTGLDPHLTTNLDWGAVSYLANSNYGVGSNGHTVEKQGKAGKKITISEKIGDTTVDYTYYSTTGNATGIMNWGANPNTTTYTQTAGMLNTATNENTVDETYKTSENVNVLLKYKTSRYVEKLINQKSTVGMAIDEVSERYTWTGTTGNQYWNWFNDNNSFPIMIRNGFFGFLVGSHVWNYVQSGAFTGGAGASRKDVTFRPVIWNIE